MNISTLKKLLKSSLTVFILLGPFFCFAQNTNEFSIVFYNVENLFDTIDDPRKNDNQYLPHSKKEWNTYKYYQKLENTSKAIIASGKWNMPDIIGIAEVETKKCALDLIHKTPLTKAHYNLIYYESPDFRGIDVACFYNPETFKVINSVNIPVSFTGRPQMKTRDILHITGVITKSEDTLDIFFCHFPSRFGGTKKTEFKRLTAAQTLKNYTDSLEQIGSPKIIIMGDLNDTPQDSSIAILTDNSYQNLMNDSYYGTHYYNNTWNHLDQCIANYKFTKNFNYTYEIIHNNFLLTTDSKGRKKPFRTYQGPFFKNGYSDHLPIILRIKI
jgi:exonuclease III